MGKNPHGVAQELRKMLVSRKRLNQADALLRFLNTYSMETKPRISSQLDVLLR